MLKLKEILTETFINPFGDDVDPALLLNIASGSPVSSEVEKSLLCVVKRGEDLHSEFTSRFEVGSENKLNFWDPIKKQEWQNSPASNKKTKVENKNGKVRVTSCEVTTTHRLKRLLSFQYHQSHSLFPMRMGKDARPIKVHT